MNLRWEKTILTTGPRDQIYSYLSNIELHHEWAGAFARMERIAEGDESGVGRRYMTWETYEFGEEGSWKRKVPGASGNRTQCEVTELVPGERIAWKAQPVPSFGGRAELSFDLSDGAAGTLVTQRIIEHYPKVTAFIMRTFMGITEEGILELLDRTLDNLQQHLDDRFGQPVEETEAAH